MTRIFDEIARKNLERCEGLFGNELPSGSKPKELEVKQVSSSILRPYIASGHYSRTYPDSTRESFAGFYGLTLSAGVTFGMGANHSAFTALIPNIELGTYRELTRLWVDNDAPRNTASKLVSSAMKLLPEEVSLIISFADTAQGHTGFIYQALNFYFLGVTQVGKTLFDENGHSVHPRLLGVYRMRRPEFANMTGTEIAQKLGWTFGEGSVKYRYGLAIGRKLQKQKVNNLLSKISLPYPKSHELK